MDERDLKELLAPRSVALIGASRSPGKVGHDILKNLLASGYEGPIVPVNRRADSILGVKAYPSLKDYGRPVDLVVIAVPAAGVMDALRQAIRNGVGAVAVISASAG